MDRDSQPAAARTSGILIGVLCGIGAAFGWAAGFVAAKHGISIGFSPADLAFDRFFWTGLLLMPIALRDGVANLGGIGWGRGLVMSVLSGPPQAMIAYSGFILVPLGHGTTIQPACAALFGLILATVVLRERATDAARHRRRHHHRRADRCSAPSRSPPSAATASAATCCSSPPDCSGRSFGTLLRYCRVSGTRAIARGRRAVGRRLRAALCALRRLRRHAAA